MVNAFALVELIALRELCAWAVGCDLSLLLLLLLGPIRTLLVISGHNLQTCLRAAVRFVANLTLLPDNFTVFSF